MQFNSNNKSRWLSLTTEISYFLIYSDSFALRIGSSGYFKPQNRDGLQETYATDTTFLALHYLVYFLLLPQMLTIATTTGHG